MLVACDAAPAQTNDLDLGDLLDAAQQFAQENLDPDVLQALQSVDRDKVEDFLNHYQDYLRGDYVLDVAQLKDAANAILPLLDAHEETQPYAAWLRERLDYFDVADELKPTAPPPQARTRKTVAAAAQPAVQSGTGNLDQASVAPPVAERRGGNRAASEGHFCQRTRAGGTGLAGGGGIRF